MCSSDASSLNLARPQMAQEDFEPKWFKHVPDPVYQLMHPAKCCWCLCVIPTGAIALTLLALLSGISALSGGAAELALLEYKPHSNSTQTTMSSFRQHTRNSPAASMAFFPSFAADVSLKLLSDYSWISISPTRQRPHEPVPTRSDVDNQVVPRDTRGTRLESRASIYTSMLEGALQLAAGGLAVPAVFCGGSALSLRRSAELQFGTAFLFPVLHLVMFVATADVVAVTMVSTGIGAVLSFIFGVHYAGVVYQYARILHVKESGTGAGDMAGAEAVPPPHHGTGPTQAARGYSDGPGSSAAAVRVHTSGVAPTSGL